MSGRLDASDRGIYIRVEEEPAPRVGVRSKSSRHAVAAVQAVDDGQGSAVYAEGHSTVAPAVAVRGYGPLVRIERWDGTKWVVSATLAADGTFDVEALTVDGSELTGGGTPASAVVAETSFGQSSAVGIGTAYARADHTHGTPAAPASPPSAAASVTDETSYGVAKAIGVSTAYARQDHTHGTPAAVGIATARTTAGNITFPDTLGSWALLSGVSELAIDAAVGDWVEIGVSGMRSQTSGAWLDTVVVTGVGPTIQRYLTTGTSSPPTEGDPSWYPVTTFALSNGPRGFVVASGDLDSGQVRFRLACKSTGSGTLYASSDYPFTWFAKNFRH